MKDFWTEFSAGLRPVAAEKPLGAATIMASGTAGDCMGVLFPLVDEERGAAPQVMINGIPVTGPATFSKTGPDWVAGRLL